MTLSESEGVLRNQLGIPLERVPARAGIAAMLQFYEEERPEGLVDQDGDMLLLQWGTHGSSGKPPTFQLNVTRQLRAQDKDEPYQLSLTFHYASTGAAASIAAGNRWCHSISGLEDFRNFAEQLPAMTAIGDLAPLRVELTFSQV